MSGLRGSVGQLVLGGPLVLRHASAPSPEWGEKMDLLVPLTGNPLGQLARKCPLWAAERWVRPLFTLPFVLGEVPEAWHDRAADIREFLGVDSLLAFVPDPRHWDRAFSRIPEGDFGGGPVPEFLPEVEWSTSGVMALWDIQQHRVLWAEGLRTREEMLRDGKTLDDWASQAGGTRPTG
jgi:hypothetical protein